MVGEEQNAASDPLNVVTDVPGVFGVDIDLHGQLVQIVHEALEWLNSNHLSSEGLWRVSGSRREVKKSMAVVEQSKSFPFDEIGNFALMTGLLISFLQQIPGGLIDTETTTELLAVSGGTDASSERLVQFIESRISANKFRLFELLMHHWRLVVATSDNKMNASAVATCVFAVVFPGVMDMKLIGVVNQMLSDKVEEADTGNHMCNIMSGAVPGYTPLDEADATEVVVLHDSDPSGYLVLLLYTGSV